MLFKRFLCALLLSLLSAGLFGCAGSPQEQSYRQGRSALAAGQLAEAAGHFGALGDYKDCPQQLQAVYDQALELYRAEDHLQAAEAFRVLAEFEFLDSRDYAAACQALACLEKLDGCGARAALAEGNIQSPPLSDILARAEQMLFPGTGILRPEYAARELASGEVAAQIRQVAAGSNPKYLYAMEELAADRVYRQYRDYCKAAFPDSFRDESENYFSFRADGVLCYVSNFYSVDGGMVILISAV